VLVLVQVLVLAVLARGSIGTFPLIRRDVAYSADAFVNAMVLNAPVELYKAARQRSKEIDIGNDPAAGLRALGFSGVQDAARAAGFGDHPSEDAIAARLFATAPGTPRPVAASPHVVLALLESFGADLLDVDGPGNDMLGRLRAELPKGYRFGNFIAGQNGTHPELEYLLLGSPITPLTQGANAGIGFDNSAALPFLKAGYHTAFVYGGGADWRNIGRTFARQGFERIYDARDIRQRYPQATGTDWGLYDKYLFDFVADLLKQADARGERLFVFVLSTTNHPPYALDTPHAALPLDATVLGARAGSPPGAAQDIGDLPVPGRPVRRLPAEDRCRRAGPAHRGGRGRRSQPARPHPLHAAAGAAGRGQGIRLSARARCVAPGGGAGPAGHCRPRRPDSHVGGIGCAGTALFRQWPGSAGTCRGRWRGFATVQRLYLRQGVLFPLDHPLVHRWQGPHRIDPAGIAPDAALLVRARAATAQLGLRDWYIRREVIAARAAGKHAAR
jgi:hypothetical protein